MTNQFASSGVADAVCVGLRGSFETIESQHYNVRKITNDPPLYVAASILTYCPELHSMIPGGSQPTDR